MGLKTTSAGWFPKPHAVRLARWRHAEGEIDGAELVEITREATRAAIGLQRAIGLDALVDPQMGRGDLVGGFGDRIDGLESGGLVRCWGNRYYRRPRIVDELAWSGPVTVDGWRLAQEAAGEVPVRAVLPGPYTMVDWSFDEHHATRADAAAAFAGVIAAEAVALVEAGATELELAEPAAGARPDELPLVADGIERVRDAIDGRARVWLRAGLADPGVDPTALVGLPADVLLLPSVRVEALGALADGRALAAGLLDVHDQRVEAVDALREAARRLLDRVPAERLWLAPDGGLQALEPSVAEAKLRALVEAARGV